LPVITQTATAISAAGLIAVSARCLSVVLAHSLLAGLVSSGIAALAHRRLRGGALPGVGIGSPALIAEL
jgi:hypothetical protein